MLEQKARMLARALELGVSSEAELEALLVGDSSDAPAAVAAAPDAATFAVGSVDDDAALPAVAIAASDDSAASVAVPASSGFAFM